MFCQQAEPQYGVLGSEFNSDEQSQEQTACDAHDYDVRRTPAGQGAFANGEQDECEPGTSENEAGEIESTRPRLTVLG